MMPRSVGCACGEQCQAKLRKVPRRLVKVYVAVFICFFSSSLSVTVMFPFVPFMVEFLLPWLTESEELVATYVGILVSAPYFGRIFGSYVWGAIADHKGRKPVLIVSLLLVGLSTAMFGFSVSFEMALIVRFLAGLFSGIIGACKAVVSEVSDDSTQAFGVTMLGTSWLLGLILGPAVSGAISDPIGQYNLTIEHTTTREFLTRFPYSPPCLLSALLCAVSVLVTLFMLPETLGMKKNRKRSEIVSSNSQATNQEPETDGVNEDSTQPECDHSDSSNVDDGPGTRRDAVEEVDGVPPNESCNSLGAMETDSTQLLSHDNKEREEVQAKHRRSRLRENVLKVFHQLRNSVKNLINLLRDKSTFLSLLVYAVFSAMELGFGEIYPVWAKTSPHLGGPGLSLNEIGITQSVSSIVLIPVSLVIFPLLERKLGLLKIYYIQSVIIIPTMMLLPNIHYLYNIKWLLFVLLCTLLLTIQVCFSTGFNCQAIFINNSVTFDKLGKINGIGTALTAFIRAISSLVSGRIFSLSLLATAAGLGYPLDYRLLFLVFGTVIYVCVLLTACLPVSINKQKIVEDIPREHL